MERLLQQAQNGAAPVVRVFDTHVQVAGLQGGLHGGGVQNSGAKEGELRGLLICEQRHRPRLTHNARIRCEHACIADIPSDQPKENPLTPYSAPRLACLETVLFYVPP